MIAKERQIGSCAIPVVANPRRAGTNVVQTAQFRGDHCGFSRVLYQALIFDRSAYLGKTILP
jgi:hypothetical protein